MMMHAVHVLFHTGLRAALQAHHNQQPAALLYDDALEGEEEEDEQEQQQQQHGHILQLDASVSATRCVS